MSRGQICKGDLIGRLQSCYMLGVVFIVDHSPDRTKRCLDIKVTDIRVGNLERRCLLQPEMPETRMSQSLRLG